MLQTVASSKFPRQRRDWTDTETSLLWELCETAYSLGKLTGKKTRANSGRWDNLEKDFNPELASRNMATRTLQQMKEKINNLKSDHKKNKDKNHKQTGKPNPTNLCGLTWLIMLFSSKDKINSLILFCSSEGRYENKKKAKHQEEGKGHKDQLGDGDEMFASSTSKGAGKCNADCNRESSNLEQTPGKRLCNMARAKKAKKLNEEGSSKGLINVVDKQIKLLLEAQERDDKMMERLIQLEETPKERQKEILMTIINKL